MSPELIDYLSKAGIVALVAFYFRSQRDANSRADAARQTLREEMKTGMGELKDIIRDVKAELRSLMDTDKKQGQDILENSIRIRQVEHTQSRFEAWKDDVTGFFQKLGYRKRDGNDE